MADKRASITISVRIDLSSLASVALYYKSSGLPVRSMSSLVSSAVKDLVVILRLNDAVDKVESIEEAYNILANLGIMSAEQEAEHRARALRNLSLYMPEVDADIDAEEVHRAVELYKKERSE